MNKYGVARSRGFEPLRPDGHWITRFISSPARYRSANSARILNMTVLANKRFFLLFILFHPNTLFPGASPTTQIGESLWSNQKT